MGWNFFKSSGDRKVANFNYGPATPVGGTTRSLQTGLVAMFPQSVPPAGWLPCDGRSYSTTTYANLFAVISYTYGGGGGTFNVPNLAGYTIMGDSAGAQDGGSGTGAISGGTAIGALLAGDSGGASTIKLLEAETATDSHQHGITESNTHYHTYSDPGHSHNVAKTARGVQLGVNPGVTLYHWGTIAFPTTETSHTVTVEDTTPSFTVGYSNGNATDFHENRQPYTALAFMIKT